jgi:hypothetical protein
MDSFIVSNIFAGNTTFLKAIDILRITNNPGIISYLAWFCSTLFDFIRTSYRETKIKLIKSNIKLFCVWMALTKSEAKAMEIS